MLSWSGKLLRLLSNSSLEPTTSQQTSPALSSASHSFFSSQSFLACLHRFLGLRRQPKEWYPARLREELISQSVAKTAMQRLSETADVFYIISRAQYEGVPIRGDLLPPFVASRHLVVYAYMLAKYISRWAFYRAAAYLCQCPHTSYVREVADPARETKLVGVALRNHIDPNRFVRVCRRLRRVWFLFP